MRSLLVVPVFAFAAVALAQQPAQITVQTADGQPARIVLGANLPANCPVSLQALKTPQGAALKQTAPTVAPRGVALNIVLRALADQPIRQAKVLVTGISGAQVLPADATPAAGSDLTEEFTLSNAAAPKAKLESVVYTQRLTGIRTVALTEITWADGTSWHAAPGTACRVTPSLFLEANAQSR